MAKGRRERAPRTDHELGIHTTRPMPLDGLEIASPNRVHGKRYEPTPYGILDELLSWLDVEYRRFTFVDLGSGKGRVLCLAAALPFRRVLGVEFAPELHAIAVENLAALPAGHRRTSEARSILADAATYALPHEPLVLFLFNPFEAGVLARVIEGLERSLAELPREIFVLYYMPVHEDVVDRSPAFVRLATSKDWVIWAATPLPSA
jgi:SAM-dependent methyltransferase